MSVHASLSLGFHEGAIRFGCVSWLINKPLYSEQLSQRYELRSDGPNHCHVSQWHRDRISVPGCVIGTRHSGDRLKGDTGIGLYPYLPNNQRARSPRVRSDSHTFPDHSSEASRSHNLLLSLLPPCGQVRLKRPRGAQALLCFGCPQNG